MNNWKPFYDIEYLSTQLKVVGWLFTMFSYNGKDGNYVADEFGERVRLFSKSLNRAQVENGNGLALNKTPRQLYRAILNRLPNKETEHYRDSLADWTGQLYVLLNWKFGISHKELSNLDWDEIYKLSVILHETSLSTACRKLITKYGLVPRGDDSRVCL